MLTITATAGAANANSFVTEAEAIEYAATRLNLIGWATVAGIVCTENEKKALVEATRELNSILDFKGSVQSATQALVWPREGAYNEQHFFLYTYTGIPQALKEATTELAIEFLRAGTTDIARADPQAGVIKKKVDVLETEWAQGSRLSGLARFPRVVKLLAPLRSSSNEVVRS